MKSPRGKPQISIVLSEEDRASVQTRWGTRDGTIAAAQLLSIEARMEDRKAPRKQLMRLVPGAGVEPA